MNQLIIYLKKGCLQLIVANIVIAVISLFYSTGYILIIPLIIYGFTKYEYNIWLLVGVVFNLVAIYIIGKSVIFTIMMVLSSGTSILIVTIIYKAKIEKRAGKINRIIKKILDLKCNTDSNVIKDESTRLNETSNNIIEILNHYYDFDYTSIFIKGTRGFALSATNIGPSLKGDLEKAVQEFITQIESEDSSGLILESKNLPLTYLTAKLRGIRYACVVPLGKTNNYNGVLLLENKEKALFTKKEQEMFETLTESISLVIQYMIYESKILSTALVDGLTGLYNRTYLKMRFTQELERHKIQGKTFCIAVMDIDHFKKFNDTYGHLFGDLVLKSVSEYIKEKVRDEDIPTRFGGEEIVILFAESSIENINERVEQIRKGISTLEISDGAGTNSNVTVSFGVSQYPDHGQTIEELIKSADKAVYLSKETGRNKVTIYTNQMTEV